MEIRAHSIVQRRITMMLDLYKKGKERFNRVETSMGGNIIIWAIYNIICVASEIHLTVLINVV